MELFAIAAAMLIIWMCWQLYRARRYNQFKAMVQQDLKPRVVEHLTTKLQSERSDATPNTDAHIAASQYFYTQFPARTLQVAIEWEIVNEAWLKEHGYIRFCQHLFFVDRDKLIDFSNQDDQLEEDESS
ncbi:MAG: hypothetical protein MK214_00785 [Thalassotalea sp.]|nr:hypothetical protein [Thalassotalea sp.]